MPNASEIPEILPKAERLRNINDVLESVGIPPWTADRLGDLASGTPEIIDFADFREIGPRRIQMDMRLLLPSGDVRTVKMYFGGKIIYVVPLLDLHGVSKDHSGMHIAFLKRWRIECGGSSIELPHGLVDDRHTEDEDRHPQHSPAHQILERAFGKRLVEATHVASVHRIGTVLVNGEWRPAETYVFASMIEEKIPRKEGEGEVCLIKVDDLKGILMRDLINDINTVAILNQALRRYLKF